MLYCYSWGFSNQYDILLVQDMVPWEVLESWRGAIFFESVLGKLIQFELKCARSLNLRAHLESYLWCGSAMRC